MENEIVEALINVLEIYGQTTEPVSQKFYQGLCQQARGALIRQAAEIDKLKESTITKELKESPDQ